MHPENAKQAASVSQLSNEDLIRFSYPGTKETHVGRAFQPDVLVVSAWKGRVTPARKKRM
jgi:hypothetical protein